MTSVRRCICRAKPGQEHKQGCRLRPKEPNPINDAIVEALLREATSEVVCIVRGCVRYATKRDVCGEHDIDTPWRLSALARTPSDEDEVGPDA